MKKAILILLISSLYFTLGAQSGAPESKKLSLTVGVLNGGGSLIGADVELLLTKKFGIQVGAGFRGYGAGLNYHFRPSIRSSFLSFQYWHQGFGDYYAQSLAGLNYVYRGKRWLTAQLGVGIPLEEGPAWPIGEAQPSILLMYSIGAYFPL